MPYFFLSSRLSDAGGEVEADDGKEGLGKCPLFSLSIFGFVGLLP